MEVDESVMAEDEGWLKDKSNTSWAAYHARKQLNRTDVEADSVMLPIWRDDSKSPATIKHVLDTPMASTNHLNPGQTSVIGLDQPLYAIAKKIQWHCAETYGKDRLVLMLGNLHIEMVGGQWLDHRSIECWSNFSWKRFTMHRTCRYKN